MLYKIKMYHVRFVTNFVQMYRICTYFSFSSLFIDDFIYFNKIQHTTIVQYISSSTIYIL